MGLFNINKYSNFFPFGMLMPNRSDNSAQYRFGYQGQEKDDETKGQGNSISFKYRIYDSRTGRFLSIDPLTKQYPKNSPYSFAQNNVIQFIELEGLEIFLSKAQKLDYGGGWGDFGTFLYNSAAAGYNQFVTAFNYAGMLDEIDNEQGTVLSLESHKKIANDAVAVVDGINNYVATTTVQEFAEDVKDAASDIETYENLAPDLLFGGMLKYGKIGKYGRTPKALDITRQSVDDKLARYLLNKEHPIGGSKADWFDKALGFTKDNADDLAKQINFDPSSAVKTGTNKQGTLYKQMIDIKGANGKTIKTQFNFIKHTNGDVKLVGALPTKNG